MDIVEWFDINNIEHLKAYRTLMVNGAWPLGFIPNDINFSPIWQLVLAYKLSNAYIDLRLIGE